MVQNDEALVLTQVVCLKFLSGSEAMVKSQLWMRGGTPKNDQVINECTPMFTYLYSVCFALRGIELLCQCPAEPVCVYMCAMFDIVSSHFYFDEHAMMQSMESNQNKYHTAYSHASL